MSGLKYGIDKESKKRITPREEMIDYLVNRRKDLTEECQKLSAEIESLIGRRNEIDDALEIIENGLGTQKVAHEPD